MSFRFLATLALGFAIPVFFPSTGRAADLAEKISAVQVERDPSVRLGRWADLAKDLTLEEIPEALQAADDRKEWRDRAVLQSLTLQRWGALSPGEAATAIRKFPESRHKLNCLDPLLRQWATTDPSAASHFTAALPPGQCRQSLLSAVAETWAAKDARAAIAWSESLTTDTDRTETLQSILFIWVHQKPEESWPYLQRLAPGAPREALISNTATAMAKKDPRHALAWAKSLISPAERDVAITSIVEAWADREPPEAAQYVSSLPIGPLRLSATNALTRAWVYQNPSQVADWLLNQDPGLQVQAVPPLIRFWSDMDPVAAGKWIAALPPSPIREQAIPLYVEAAVSWSPREAAQLALTLTDESVRGTALNQCLSRWQQIDADGLKTWSKAAAPSPASPSQKSPLQKNP